MNLDILVYTGLFVGLYFAIFIMATFFENKDKIYKKAKKDFLPRICFIVPCYNEQDNIEQTIASLLMIDYPKDKLEIIVVDDGSKDKTFEKALLFQKYGVRVFRKENGGKHTALNFAIKKTDAPFIGTLDADSYIKPNALKKMMAQFEDDNAMACISTIKISKMNNIVEGIQYVEFILSAFFKKMYSLLGSVMATPGPLSVFRKEIFDIVGPYKKAYQTEDLEFAFRIQNSNFKIASAIDAIVYTKPCSNMKDLLFQRLRWCRGFLLNLIDYPCLLNIKKHGNLSFFLFYNLLGRCLSVAFLFFAIWKTICFLMEKINYYLLVGIDSSMFSININSINIKPTIILTGISLCIFIMYLIMSKKLTFDYRSIKKQGFMYILLYTFLNATWWIGAIFLSFSKKDVFWK